MRFLIFALATLCYTNPLFAQNLEVEKFTIRDNAYIEYSFGTFSKGKKQTLELYLKNNGSSPLQLKTLELGCDCLKAGKLQGMPIPPGARVKLKIIHKAQHKGAFNVFARLFSNAENAPEFWIKLSGVIE